MNMMVGAIKYEGKRGKKKGITLVRKRGVGGRPKREEYKLCLT